MLLKTLKPINIDSTSLQQVKKWTYAEVLFPLKKMQEQTSLIESTKQEMPSQKLKISGNLKKILTKN